MISCVSSNMHMGLAVGPAVIVPFMLLGGYYLNDGYRLDLGVVASESSLMYLFSFFDFASDPFRRV